MQQLQHLLERIRVQNIRWLQPCSASLVDPGRNKVQLTKRYRQLFNEQTDAAACFNKAKPEVDTANPKHFTVACPDAAGNEVVIYHFEQTRTGWKLTSLDNINE